MTLLLLNDNCKTTRNPESYRERVAASGLQIHKICCKFPQDCKSSGAGDISFNFKGIDFYKGTETGNQIFANTAVSMKTTIQTDVNTWLNYQSIKDNIKFLRDGMSSTGMIDPNNVKTMFITDAKIHIYMPKANVTPTLKTQWMNKLNTDYPDIGFEIKAIEDFIN